MCECERGSKSGRLRERGEGVCKEVVREGEIGRKRGERDRDGGGEGRERRESKIESGNIGEALRERDREKERGME